MKYPTVYAYNQFERLICEKEVLSLRKQFCYAFIRWGHTAKMEDKIKFVELAKEFRKGRIGQHRTLLERKARKLYRGVRKHLNRESCRQGARKWGLKTKAEGIGVHSPEYKAAMKERNKRIRQILKEKQGGSTALHWRVFAPDGRVFEIVNLKGFCREHGLARTPMHDTSFMVGKTYKGWRAEKLNKEWDSL